MRATLWILVLCLWGSSQANRHFTIDPKEATDLDHNKNASHFVIMPKVDVMDNAHFSIDLEEIEDLGPIESRAKLIMNPGDTATISSTGTSGYHRQVEVFKTNPENDIKIECIGSFEDPRNCRKFKFIFKDGVENIRKRVKCGDGVKVMHSSTTGFLKMIFKSRHLYAEFSFTCSVTCYAKMSTTTTTSTTVNGPNCNTFNGISCADNETATCGVPSTSRIVGGAETTIESVPWQVALAIQGSTHPYCGGTIVNSRFIVTAAHCVIGDNPSNVFVVVGETDIQTFSTRLAVESITIHEGYDDDTLANDIAVIELVEPLTFSDSVKPACAPEANNDYVGDIATVSGWGTLYTDGPQPNILNKVDVNIISFEECQNDYNNELTAGMICAKDTEKDSCQGDSGGPLVNQTEGVYALVGVVSWGYGCARPEYPGVYTEVEHFLDWINDIISSGGLQCELML